MRFDRYYFARYFDLLLSLTQKELRVRYKNYALGYLWSLAQPVIFAAVFYFAFKVILKVPTENFVFFLLSGLFPWQWMANSINMSPVFFLNNAAIIKKVAFPRHAVVESCVLQDALHFLLSLPILVVIAALHGKAPDPLWLVGIPLLTAVQMGFIVGVSLTMASINMFFRDLERMTTLMTMLLFYFTPIVYAESQVPAAVRQFLFLNPAMSYILGWRSLFMEGAIHWPALGWGCLHAAFALTVGVSVYRGLSPKFAEVI